MDVLWPGRGGPVIDYISPPPSREWRSKKPRAVTVLGSTGSVGRATVAILERFPRDFRVYGLACAGSVELLADQATRLRPALLAVLDQDCASRLVKLLPAGYAPEIVWGRDGYVRMAAHAENDLVVCAQVGAAGLPATIAAALAGHVLALANKESLVLAGRLLRRVCNLSGAAILPLDSEHFALFQCLAGRGEAISKLVLTASGGPFRSCSAEELRKVDPASAVRHPNWKMGRKISVDSATLMNKGLEVIEAAHLFGVAPERIEVLVHPQSIVHSLVQLADNSMLSQLSVPDMSVPIAACLFWPQASPPLLPAPDLASLGRLDFENVDTVRFPALSLAKSTLEKGASCTEKADLEAAAVLLNAANEEAVNQFLAGACGFCQIAELVAAVLDSCKMPDLWINLPEARNVGQIADFVEKLWSQIGMLDEQARAKVRALL